MGETRSEFRNDSGGVAGAVKFTEEGKRRSVAVSPDDTVWLTEDERIATANAPRSDDDNPFQDGTFTLLTAAKDVKNRRPYGPDTPPETPPESPTVVAPSPEDAQAAEDAKAEAEATAKREEQETLARAAAAQKARQARDAAKNPDPKPEVVAGPKSKAEAKASAPATGSRLAQEVVGTAPTKE